MPILILGVATLRVAMLQCLLRTYEFWFMSGMNLATCVIVCGYFRDIRALSMVACGETVCT